MLNSLREWGERRSTRVFREKPAKNASNFEGVCTVTITCYALVQQRINSCKSYADILKYLVTDYLVLALLTAVRDENLNIFVC
jgi:hypothetical protein